MTREKLFKEVCRLRKRKDVLQKRAYEVMAKKNPTHEEIEEMGQIQEELLGMLKRMTEINRMREDFDNFNLI